MLEGRLLKKLIREGADITLTEIAFDMDKIKGTMGPFKTDFDWVDESKLDTAHLAECVHREESDSHLNFNKNQAIEFVDKLYKAYKKGIVKHYELYVGIEPHNINCDVNGILFTEKGVFPFEETNEFVYDCRKENCDVIDRCPVIRAYKLGKFKKYSSEK